MPKYLVLMNYTEKGVANMKESPQRLKGVRAAFEETGGKLDSFYLTLGHYDAVSIVDFPDDATLATSVLKLAAQGNVRTSTLRAFDEAEYEEIAGRL